MLSSNDVDRAGRQGFQEGASVAFGEDPRVEDGDDAVVGLGANEAADALAQLEDRLR